MRWDGHEFHFGFGRFTSVEELKEHFASRPVIGGESGMTSLCCTSKAYIESFVYTVCMLWAGEIALQNTHISYDHSNRHSYHKHSEGIQLLCIFLRVHVHVCVCVHVSVCVCCAVA